ncbi:putative dead deah box helicase protein [Hirsutella rhossiliensis]|uniref:Dead deah box helicase protein n=1 Tax=Hirsutella rhossiliensis TaxID=111463 RepID=A0A9P8MRN4_9HYPO|nr:putative dead deah box helicase protein [Hirsutella rhossiliensis]KAH0959904.1 putative dead deah box helicase protein [Hirsutella rhossiliensis]
MAQNGGEAELRAWYQAISPLRVDLVGDFAGKELFAIHGDSLLLHCLTEARVDFTNGFQLLHAIHAVESFLARLEQRGCNFHILWFRDHEHLCVPEGVSGDAASNCLRLSRIILIKHLEHYAQYSRKPAGDPLVFEYDNVDSNAFQQYLAQNAVQFFLCLDGCALDGCASPTGVQYLEFIHHIAFHGYSVALMNSLDFVSSKVLVSAFSPSSCGNEIRIEKPRPSPRTQILAVSELELDLGLEPGSWSPWADGKPLSVKDAISFTALCNMLLVNSKRGIRACAAAYVLHLSALRHCSLSQRSCMVTTLDTHEQECLDDFFAFFADICISIVESLPIQQRWDAFDLLDGRVMRQIFKNLGSLAPSPGIVGEARSFAERIYLLTQVDISDLIPPSSVDKAAETTSRAFIQSENGSNSHVMPFTHPVLDKFLEPVRLVTEDSVKPTGNPKVFQELSHWHNAKTPIDPKHEHRRPPGFFAQRRNQRWMADMIAYSASLTNASGKIINPETIVARSDADTIPVKPGKKARSGEEKLPKQAAHQPRARNKNHPVKGGRESAGQKLRENLIKRFLKADKYLACLSKEDTAIIGAEVTLYTCNILASLILDEKRRGAGPSVMSLFAMMWSRTLEIGLRKVLDAIDADKSLLVVAPTSAGKTFISFYAMKRSCNRATTAFCARFSKSYTNNGRSVWAIHTRDYRINNPTGCQILVTVPHILQIMLLAPSNAEGHVVVPKGVELEMIVHSLRYSDLRKFTYSPPNENYIFRGLMAAEGLQIPGLDEGDGGPSPFSFIHPVVGLVNRNRGTLEDITLEPRDCLALWRCMSKHQTTSYPMDEALSPLRVFPAIAKKPDVVRWEEGLKRILEAWMQDPRSPFSAVRSELGSAFLEPDSPSPDGASVDSSSFGVNFEVKKNILDSTALPLLTDLHRRGALPAILFNYDRDHFQNGRKLAEYEKWKKANSQANRGKDKTNSAAKGRSRDEPELSKIDLIRESSTEASRWESFDPEAPLDLFSFANRTSLLDSELATLVGRLRDANLDPGIISALRRGIAVHHAGMNRGYRQTVEMLFRKGFLTVVIATGTLALGLNMPCKTVVFFGDSIFLTALNYLQGAGRAGRRGFDLLGNVVFTGMPPKRTRLYLGGPSDQMAIQHHLRFSIEYLRRQHLLSRDGTPLNFSGLVGHLYFTENAVFAFHSLLKEGYFHQICRAIYSNPEGVLLKLVLVLAHLFCRIPVRNSSDEWIASIVHKSPSVVLLPSLPGEAEELLRDHNRETLEIFRAYVSTFVEQHLSGSPDTQLPFTGYEIQQQQHEQDAPSIIQSLPPTKIRSSFAALSGFTDDFNTIHELCTTVRSGVFLEESAIPYIRIFPDDTAGVPWNAYLYDFFKHGDLTALVRDNGIKRGDVCLTNFLSLDPAVDDAMMVDVQGIDDIIQEDHDELHSSTPGNTASNAVPDPAPSVTEEFDEKFRKVWA